MSAVESVASSDSGLIAQVNQQSAHAGRFWVDVFNSSGKIIDCVEVQSQTILIGRGRHVGIRLEDDAVSRRHAQIYRDPFNRIWIRDLNSKNGITINGQRVGEHPVIESEAIHIGNFVLRLRQDAPRNVSLSCETLPDTAEFDIDTIGPTKEHYLSAAHLDLLVQLGDRLSQIRDSAARSTEACETLLRPELRGEAAWVLRVSRKLEAHPAILSGPHVAAEQGSRRYRISQKLVSAVVQSNRPQMATRSQRGDTSSAGNTADMRLVCGVACPLTSNSEYTDILYAVFPMGQSTTEWLALTTLVASLYSQAEGNWIRRLQLEAHSVIENDLKAANRIQQQIIPRAAQFDGLDVGIVFEPCRWVGGDYVDIIRIDADRVLFAVADACGKGMPAALVASWIHTIVRTGCRANLPLSQIMFSIREHLMENLPADSFVTMFAVVLNARTGDVEYANAGHPAGLVLASGGSCREMGEGSLPLRVDEVAPETFHDRIETGDVLVLFTDGWTDVPNPTGETLGCKAFREQLAGDWHVNGAGPVRGLLHSLNLRFAGSLRESFRSDDRTLIAVKRL